MKNPGIIILIFICCICIAFTGGLFLGRNFNHSEIQVSIHNETNYSGSENEPDKVTEKININTATAEELETLPGIGETLAGRIIEYRTEHGKFNSVSELINVSGIGNGRLEAILNYITVGE